MSLKCGQRGRSSAVCGTPVRVPPRSLFILEVQKISRYLPIPLYLVKPIWNFWRTISDSEVHHHHTMRASAETRSYPLCVDQSRYRRDLRGGGHLPDLPGAVQQPTKQACHIMNAVLRRLPRVGLIRLHRRRVVTDVDGGCWKPGVFR